MYKYLELQDLAQLLLNSAQMKLDQRYVWLITWAAACSVGV